MKVDWAGGVFAEVLESGDIAIGDEVEWERNQEPGNWNQG
jgi:MOSC domain-containing protein YiiM